MVETRMQEKELELQLAVNQEIPAYLFGDDVRIKQIISNPMTNVVKYTHKGSVRLELDGRWRENEFYL